MIRRQISGMTLRKNSKFHNMLVAARKKLLYTLPTCVAASCTTWTLRGEAKVCNVEIVPYSFGETTLILKTRINMTKNVSGT